MDIVKAVASLISEDPQEVGEYFAAVACIEHQGKWLLGLSTSKDDRKGFWLFPGGGTEDGETPEQTAKREAHEETGVNVRPIGKAFERSDKPGVAFVYCKVLGTPHIKHNNEFSDMGFFSEHEMKSLKLYHNVKSLIQRC